MNRILIAGATGIAGVSRGSSLRRAARLGGRRPVAARAGRRAECAAPAGGPAECRAVQATFSRRLNGITHLAYMALHEQDDLLAGWRARRRWTRIWPCSQICSTDWRRRVKSLRHITILQGSKAYGSHLHPVPVPAKERWPRGDHDIFYWPQEDLLRERQRGQAWQFSILRPMMILGDSIGSPMSIIAALGVYASIMKRLGEPLRFPGGGRYVISCTDSRLIAQAIEFVGTVPQAAGETYNVVNGDVIVWHDLWPSLARHFDMPMGEPAPMRLAEEMPKLASVWDEIVAQNSVAAEGDGATGREARGSSPTTISPTARNVRRSGSS